MTPSRKQLLIQSGPRIAAVLADPSPLVEIAAKEMASKREQAINAALSNDAHQATVCAAQAAGIQDFLAVLNGIVEDYRQLGTPTA